MSWLGELGELCLSWLPRPTLLDPTEKGILISHKCVKVLEGGRLVWYVPLFQEVKVFPAVEQTADLPPQTLMAAGARALTVRGVVAYRVSDIRKVMTEAHDIDDIVQDLSRAAITRAVSGRDIEWTLEGIRSGSLDYRLTRTIRDQLSPYGLHVLRATLAEAFPCTSYRLVGDCDQRLVPGPSQT